MIHFNELYVTEDGKRLVIDAEVDDFTVYDGVYIDKITVGLGGECNGNGKDVSVYYSPAYVVGDIDNDGSITDEDKAAWEMLADIFVGTGLKLDGEGKYYYKHVIQDPITGEDLEEYIYPPNSVVVTYFAVLDKYPNTYTIGRGMDSLLMYIHDSLGGCSLNGKESIPGDLNGDGEVSISDWNAFINYLLSNSQGSGKVIVSESETHVRLCLSASDLSPLLLPSDSMDRFFVVRAYAAGGDIEQIEKMGCRWNENPTVGVAFNGKPLYNAAMRLADSYGNSCDSANSDAFIDYLLRYYGFLFALKCNDICQAKYYWDTFLSGSSVSSVAGSFKPCGCNGTR